MKEHLYIIYDAEDGESGQVEILKRRGVTTTGVPIYVPHAKIHPGERFKLAQAAQLAYKLEQQALKEVKP